MTTFLPNQWNARWIAPMEQTKRHPILFQDFSVDGPIQSAILYITGYGLFEATVKSWAMRCSRRFSMTTAKQPKS